MRLKVFVFIFQVLHNVKQFNRGIKILFNFCILKLRKSKKQNKCNFPMFLNYWYHTENKKRIEYKKNGTFEEKRHFKKFYIYFKIFMLKLINESKLLHKIIYND